MLDDMFDTAAFEQVIVVERKVKYPRLELKTGFPILVLPQEGSFDSATIISKHQRWLKQKVEFIENLKSKYKNQKIYYRREDDLIKLVAKFVKESSKIVGIKPKRIIFRYMKTKWGSCSKKGGINFNLMLKYLPRPLIRYVVFHETMHLLIPNHSKNFWFCIKKEFKNPKQYEEMLYGYWFLLNRKVKSKKKGLK